jgi:hypothetical protein
MRGILVQNEEHMAGLPRVRPTHHSEFYFFNFFIYFAKIYMIVWEHSKTNLLLTSWPMAVGANCHGPQRLGNVALQPSWPIAVRINLFSKNHSFL